MRLLQDARLVICFSVVLTFFLLTNLPHAVLGGEFLYDEEDGALVIEVKALDGLDASTKPRIVEFYSPYCGHCVRFKPKYLAVAKEVHDKYGTEVEFYGVSCAGMTALCQKYEVHRYPSVFAVREGESIDAREVLNQTAFSLSGVQKVLGLDSSWADLRQLDAEDGGEEEEKRSDGAREGDIDDDDQQVGGINDDDDVDDGVREEEEVEKALEDPAGETGKSKPGAEIAKTKEHSMDKWKDIQKQRLREREVLWLRKGKARAGSLGQELAKGSEGATQIMKANRRGTHEYTERQKKFLNVISKMRAGKRKKQEAMREMMDKGKIPFKKQISKPRIRERIPVLKRTVRMTPEEQLILDASLSFLQGLKLGVFKTTGPLSSDKRIALKDWLELLRISLPLEWAIHDTITDLIHNFEMISESPEGLTSTLAKHPFPRKKWSKSCTTRGNGFTCGFWKLLHIMTVGVAEHRGGFDLVVNGDVRDDTRVFSPLEAADTVRKYMLHFFLCSECSDHFMHHYDNCANNRRCDRLTGDEESASDADWKELAKWLWETHNEVSVRLLNERADDKRKEKRLFKAPQAGPGGAAMKDEIKALWPTIEGCISCFNEDGSYNEDSVFLHLERTYWPGYDLEDTPGNLIWFDGRNQADVGLTLLLLVLGLAALLLVRLLVTKSSVQQTMLRAKAIGVSVATGGKGRRYE